MIFTVLFPPTVVAGVVVGRTAGLYPGRCELNTRVRCAAVHADISYRRALLCSLYPSRAGLLLYASRAGLLLWRSRAKALGGNPVCFALPHIHNRAALAHIRNRPALAHIHNRAALQRIHNRAKRTGGHWWPGRAGGAAPDGPRRTGRAARAAPQGRAHCNRSRRPTVARCLQDLEEPDERFGMVKRVKAIRRFTVRTVLPPRLAALGDLVTNLRWSWSPETLDLFESIDPRHLAHGRRRPVAAAGSRPAPRVWPSSRHDEQFLGRLDEAAAESASVPRARTAGSRSLGAEAPKAIAYFSPEYGITAVLPQYSGGLGILAGDHLKTASDLGVPIIGVGLLYRRGYFNQSLSRDGWQQERYPPVDPHGLPLTLLTEADGSPVDGVGSVARP